MRESVLELTTAIVRAIASSKRRSFTGFTQHLVALDPQASRASMAMP